MSTPCIILREWGDKYGLLISEKKKFILIFLIYILGPQVSHVGFKEFSTQVENMFEIPAEYSYAVILILLLHVDDPTLVDGTATRWNVLRPRILQSIAPPSWLQHVAHEWALYDLEKKDDSVKSLQVYTDD